VSALMPRIRYTYRRRQLTLNTQCF